MKINYSGPGGASLRPLMRLSGISSLSLKRGIFSGANIEFLKGFKFLKELSIVDWKLKEADSISALTALESLSLNTPNLQTPVDLRSLPLLRKLHVDFADSITGLKSCKNLEDIFIGRLNWNSMSELNSFPNLRTAEFSEPGFLEIGGTNLPHLESLVLKAAKNLNDWNGIGSLTSLNKIFLFGAPHLKSLTEFSKLSKLEWLLLDDCRTVESLKPIAKLPRLRRVDIVGNTRVADGCVSALLELPRLEEVFFVERRDYDMNVSEIMRMVKERKR